MSAYPLMYALLDVHRTAAGLPALSALETHAPDPILDGGVGAEETRYRRLDDLAQTFAEDVAWLNRPLDGVDAQDDSRQIKFILDRGKFDEYGTEVLLCANFRPSRPPALAERCTWAQVSFPGGNDKPYLVPDNPAWKTVRALLAAVQPIYAFTTLDTDSPSVPDEYAHFRSPWHQGYSSILLGPELTSLIPAELLRPDAGFSHIERLGQGVWFTIARAALYEDSSGSDREEAERHHAATVPVWKFLRGVQAQHQALLKVAPM